MSKQLRRVLSFKSKSSQEHTISGVLPSAKQLPSYAQCNDPHLQQDLERLVKINDGASRILLISQNQVQYLEAAKTVFVSNLQLFRCLKQIQQEKVKTAETARKSLLGIVASDVPVHRPLDFRWKTSASLHISDIRIPLIWHDAAIGTNAQWVLNQFNLSNDLPSSSGDAPSIENGELQNDGYSVFCVIRVGDVIKDTKLFFDAVPGTSDVEFTDELIFENVTPDFRCVIEVYAFPKPSMKASSLFSRRRIFPAETFRKTTDQADLSSNTVPSSSAYFDLVGRCVVTLANVKSRIRSHTLELGPQLNSARLDSAEDSSVNPLYTMDSFTNSTTLCDLPLFGNICFRLVAKPNSLFENIISGLLWIRKLTASPTQMPARLYYCELRECQLFAYSIFEEPTENGSAEPKKSPTTPVANGKTTTKRLAHQFRSLNVNTGRYLAIPSGWYSYSPDSPDLTFAINARTMFLDQEPTSRIVQLEPPPHISKNLPVDLIKTSPVPESISPVSQVKAASLPIDYVTTAPVKKPLPSEISEPIAIYPPKDEIKATLGKKPTLPESPMNRGSSVIPRKQQPIILSSPKLSWKTKLELRDRRSRSLASLNHFRASREHSALSPTTSDVNSLSFNGGDQRTVDVSSSNRLSQSLDLLRSNSQSPNKLTSPIHVPQAASQENLSSSYLTGNRSETPFLVHRHSRSVVSLLTVPKKLSRCEQLQSSQPDLWLPTEPALLRSLSRDIVGSSTDSCDSLAKSAVVPHHPDLGNTVDDTNRTSSSLRPFILPYNTTDQDISLSTPVPCVFTDTPHSHQPLTSTSLADSKSDSAETFAEPEVSNHQVDASQRDPDAPSSVTSPSVDPGDVALINSPDTTKELPEAFVEPEVSNHQVDASQGDPDAPSSVTSPSVDSGDVAVINSPDTTKELPEAFVEPEVSNHQVDASQRDPDAPSSVTSPSVDPGDITVVDPTDDTEDLPSPIRQSKATTSVSEVRLSVEVLTFRIATEELSDPSVNKTKPFECSTVLEFSSPNAPFVQYLSSLPKDGKKREACDTTDAHETQKWLELLRKHVEEQEIWGAESFFKTPRVAHRAKSPKVNHSFMSSNGRPPVPHSARTPGPLTNTRACRSYMEA